MFTGWTGKEIIKTIVLFVLYVLLGYAAMYSGYYSPVYWMLFPIAAAFLMAGPLTVMMSMKRGIGSALLLPLLFFILAKLIGELSFSCAWIPFLGIIIAAELIRDILGAEKRFSIRSAVLITLLSMAMWNNGFYFGGQAYMDAAVADMGTEYIGTAAGLSTPLMYAAVVIGILLAASISERLTEKIGGISA